MRYLHLRMSGEDVALHPLVPTLTDPDVFREAIMVDWAPSFDPPRATVLLYLDGDLDAFERVLAETDVVRAHDVTRFDDDRGYAYVHSTPHSTSWHYAEALTTAGLVPTMPIRYHADGTLSIRVVGRPANLQNAVEAAPPGVETTIEKVGEYDLGRPPIPPGLPSRQHEALAAALDVGYYEVPREATRADVADRLDCAPSTASEHLQKAERALVRTYMNESG
jgi:predicted DNA binding protein